MHILKQKKAKEIIKCIEEQFNEVFQISSQNISTGTIEDTVFYFLGHIPIAFAIDNQVMMTIRGILQFHPKNRYVTVDMGAVRFVTNGADVMAPGIIDADESIEEDMPVWIRDEQHHKPLAVGIALMNGENMIQSSSGKAVKMLHYIGDPIWKLGDVDN